MKYFLVEVTKAFAVYPLKAQLTMREKLVKWMFKKNVKVIREVKEEEMKTVIKYEVTNIKRKKVEETDTNITNENIVKEVLEKINNCETLEALNEFNDETPEYKEAIEAKRIELTPDTAETTPEWTETGSEVITEGSEENTPDTAENTTNTENTPESDGLDAMEQPELLQKALDLGLNKPANTGKENLILSIRAKNLEIK